MAIASLMVLLCISWGLAFATPDLLAAVATGSGQQNGPTTATGTLRHALSPAAVAGPASNQWSQLGPSTVSSGGTIYSGRVTSMVINASNTMNLYVGTLGGVWKSEDGGASWTPLTDSQPSLAVGALALSPDQKTIYAGTGDPNHMVDSYYGAGILKSSDGGKTWSVLGASVFSQSAISAILVSSSDPNRIVVADTWAACCKGISTVLNSNGIGVFLSTDGGATWTRSLSSPGNYGVASLAQDLTNPSLIYAGDFAGAVWRSTDGGATWGLLTQAPTISAPGRVVVSVTPALPNYVFYAFTINRATLVQIARFYLTNGSIVYLPSPPATPGYSDACGGRCDYNLVMAADPSSPSVLYFGALDLYRSADGGKTWTDIGGYSGKIHPGQHLLAFSPANSGTIFAGNDGGIWKSSDGGASWTDLSAGLGSLLVNSIALGPGGSYLAGAKDNGCLLYNGGSNWNQLLGGDGGWMGYESNRTSTMFCVEPSVNFQKSMDGGHTWHWAGRGLNTVDPTVYYVPVVQYPNQSQGILLATNRIYNGSSGISNWTKTNNWNNVTAWSDVTGNLNGGSIGALQVAPSNRTVWWLGDTSGNIKISATTAVVNKVLQQPAAKWQFLAQYNGAVTGIAVNASNRYQAYASVSQHGVIKLTRVVTNYTLGTSRSCTTNGCTSVTSTTFLSSPIVTWQVLSLPFPGPNINVIKMDRATNYLYVGTDSGVYFSSDGGNSWKKAGVGLPDVPVYDMLIDSNTLVVATQGRGVWSLPLLSTVTLTLSYSIQGGGTNISPPTFGYASSGVQLNAVLSPTPTPFTVDYGSSWSVTNPLGGSTATERWEAAPETSGIALASKNMNFAFYHQFLVTFNYTVVGGGKGFAPPTVQYLETGASASTNPGSTVWVDAGSTYDYTTVLGGSTATERWSTPTPTGTAAAYTTIEANYFHQYYVGLSYLLIGGGTPTVPAFLTTSMGLPLGQNLGPSPSYYWLDAGATYSATNPLQGSGPKERWYTYQAAGKISANGTLVLNYYHQYPLTVTGFSMAERWFTVGRVAKVNVTGVFGRSDGAGSRLVAYSIDGVGNTSIAPSISNITIPVPMGSPHTLVLHSIVQYQLSLDVAAGHLLNSVTPPTVAGDDYWYDTGAAVNVVLNVIGNQSADTQLRLTGYSVNGAGPSSVKGSSPVTVLSLDHITSPEFVTTRVNALFKLDTSSGSLGSITPPPNNEPAGWYANGSSVTAVYNYVWKNVDNQSRLNAIGYSIGGSNHTIPRAGHGTFKVTVKVTRPTAIIIVSVSQYRLQISGGNGVTVSAQSQTRDGYYDAGSSLSVTTAYTWSLANAKGRASLEAYTLDGVATNVATGGSGNFTTPPILLDGFRSLVFNSAEQFLVTFQFTDATGATQITPSSFLLRVSGQSQRMAAMSGWFDNGTQISVTSVLWGGIDVSPSNQAVYLVASPTTVALRCQVYGATIRVQDTLGLPVGGATATLTLVNGTQLSRQAGPDGTISVPPVPLGRFTAVVSSSGATTRIEGDATRGSVIVARLPLSFVSLGAIAGVVIAVLAGLFFFVLRRAKGKRGKPPSQGPTPAAPKQISR